MRSKRNNFNLIAGIIFGKTERGKETVRILKLNRLGDLYRRELSALLPEFFSYFVTVRNGSITNPDQPFIRNNMQYSEYLRHGLLIYFQNEFQKDILELFKTINNKSLEVRILSLQVKLGDN